jgi:hypothetical protein
MAVKWQSEAYDANPEGSGFESLPGAKFSQSFKLRSASPSTSLPTHYSQLTHPPLFWNYITSAVDMPTWNMWIKAKYFLRLPVLRSCLQCFSLMPFISYLSLAIFFTSTNNFPSSASFYIVFLPSHFQSSVTCKLLWN